MQHVLLQLQSECAALRQELLAEVPQFSIENGVLRKDGKYLYTVVSGKSSMSPYVSSECCDWYIGGTIIRLLRADARRVRYEVHSRSCIDLGGHLGKFGLKAMLASLRALEPSLGEQDRAALQTFIESAALLI
jgi:hypothetical protein